MITHDDVKYSFNGLKRVIKLLQRKLDTTEYDLHIKNVEKYITQQEEKDELLDLYRKWFLAKTTKEQDDITNKIVALEEEMK